MSLVHGTRGVALVLAVFGTGCAHMATLRPAPKGELEVDLSVGGPMLKLFNAPIPAPLSAVGVRYGVHDRVDVQAHYHPTASVLGVLGLDVGSSVWAVKGEKGIPDVTATARLFGFTDFKAFRPYLQLGGVASWRLWNRVAPYLGVDGLVQFGAAPLFAVAAGLQGIFGRFTAQLEAKWFGVGIDTRYMVVDWISPGGIGAIGVQFGFGYRFGGPDEKEAPPPAPAAPAAPAPPPAETPAAAPAEVAP